MNRKKAFGIEDVRKIQQKISLRPFKGEKKTLIVNLYKGISTEAQNAMLKLLEEPPSSSIIILQVENSGIFLPTILSRAQIIEIKNEEDGTDGTHLENIDGVGEALLLAQNLSKDKNEAIAWLERSILSTRNNMIEKIDDRNTSYKLRKTIHQLEMTHYELKNTNVNTRLSLENLFLNLINSGNT